MTETPNESVHHCPLIYVNKCHECDEWFEKGDQVVTVLYDSSLNETVDPQTGEILTSVEMDWHDTMVYHETCYAKRHGT